MHLLHSILVLFILPISSPTFVSSVSYPPLLYSYLLPGISLGDIRSLGVLDTLGNIDRHAPTCHYLVQSTVLSSYNILQYTLIDTRLVI
ncbi:hypothetical protein BO82DRAFT_77765 [Aspergillus uvarum CBS 121591]|uniref:Secreted protein n=1 Tax=Aspergillus uvarum CBS 121591 TaxID=1448315 RepID=A0A319CBY5_9EURO|nr:hypothetical protein BO82DRAFT_77765 [Aspergillus uvarum CBS 121591]PYH81679.1 hypothetical protein BO82DRAFT_77765 [Aspergillus uvarum CBS 121591]